MSTAPDAATPVRKKPLPEIVVKEAMCTGCEICVKVCPTSVLHMIEAPQKVEGALAAVEDLNKCTTCMLCELNCPHFAIFVEPGKGESAA
ncbi:MAG: 4Fe-4S dicluster domain-containing protein [Candidatus Melainabacteria bacterium]